MLLLDAADVCGVGAAGGMPRVAQLKRPPDGALGAAADPDLRLPRRVRLGHRVVERPVLPVEVALAVPERPHQADRLVGAPAAAPELDAHELELVSVPAHPDPDRKATAGKF